MFSCIGDQESAISGPDVYRVTYFRLFHADAKQKPEIYLCSQPSFRIAKYVSLDLLRPIMWQKGKKRDKNWNDTCIHVSMQLIWKFMWFIAFYQQGPFNLHNNYDCFGRYYVLYRLPNLTFLDSRPIKKEEKDEAQRVGAYMKIVAPSSDELVSKNLSIQWLFYVQGFCRAGVISMCY